MHYLLGLAALVIGAVIATRRTRPTWFVVLTGVLVGVGALLAILSFTRVTDGLGIAGNNVLGWVFVGFSLITMLSAVFVLERRGERGEEQPPLIGDNPFDGDTDDRDDLAPGQPHPGYASAATSDATDTDTAAARAERAAAEGSPSLATHAGAAAATAAAFGDGIVPSAQETVASRPEGTGAPRAGFGDGEHRTDLGADERAAAPRADFGADAIAGHPHPHPHPSEDAVDGTAVVGADPDIATAPAETDVDAAPEGGVDEHRLGEHGHGAHRTDGSDRT